ncbi:MAG: potassium-transporting ATPase subunit KdpC [Polyangiales bacterium]
MMQLLRPALMLTVFFVALTGFAFPVAVWGVGQAVFPDQANGSLLRDAQGRVIGSRLIGQAFNQPQYFHPRPSAAGAGYDAASSSGTNLGPSSDKLVHGVQDDPSTPTLDESYASFAQLAAAYRQENGLRPDAPIPADAATRSASGLDPDISPANAALQLARVAKARGLDPAHVQQLLAAHTTGRTLGILGEPRVNVLALNLALDQRK